MDSTEERWLPIPGYEGRYDVSDLGRVRSLRSNHGPLSIPTAKHPTLTPSFPYLVVALSVKGRARIWPVHRLVLLAFVGSLPDTKPRMETRHLNGNKLDNRLANLAYGSAVDNKLDAVRHGDNRHAAATHCKRGHPFDEANTYRYTNVSGNPSRKCRACATWLNREWYRRVKGKGRHLRRAPVDTQLQGEQQPMGN